MSRVEAFATGIKIESSDQTPFWRPIKGSRWPRAAKINRSRVRSCNLTFDPENQAIKSLRRERSSNQAHFLLIKHFDCGRKRFNRQHISDYPLEKMIKTWMVERPGNKARDVDTKQTTPNMYVPWVLIVQCTINA